MIRNLSSDLKIRKVANYTGAGTTAVNSGVIDMAGYRGILALASFGTAAANNILEIQGSNTNSTGSMVRLTGSVTSPAANDANQWCEVYAPTTRYCMVVVTPNTSSTIEAAWTLLIADDKPANNAVTGTIAGTLTNNVT